MADLTGLRVERPVHVEMSSQGCAHIVGYKLGKLFDILTTYSYLKHLLNCLIFVFIFLAKIVIDAVEEKAFDNNSLGEINARSL